MPLGRQIRPVSLNIGLLGEFVAPTKMLKLMAVTLRCGNDK